MNKEGNGWKRLSNRKKEKTLLSFQKKMIQYLLQVSFFLLPLFREKNTHISRFWICLCSQHRYSTYEGPAALLSSGKRRARALVASRGGCCWYCCCSNCCCGAEEEEEEEEAGGVERTVSLAPRRKASCCVVILEEREGVLRTCQEREKPA